MTDRIQQIKDRVALVDVDAGRDMRAAQDFALHAPSDVRYLLAEVERLRSYEPCAPCRADDHDNCTGDCQSICCALAAAEAEVERLRELCFDVSDCGVAFEDPRISYLEVQIDRPTWEALPRRALVGEEEG